MNRDVIKQIRFDPALSQGARNATQICLRVQRDEPVAIIADEVGLDIAAALVEQVEEIGAPYRVFVLEELAPRPLEHMPAVVLADLETSAVSIFAAQAQRGELRSRMEMMDVVNRQRLRHGHMVNITRQIMLQGMRAESQHVDRLCEIDIAKAPQADAVPAVPAGASMRMTASLASGTPALDIPLRWRIFKSGDSHSLGESEGPDFSARLEPGTYDIEAETGSITVRQTVTIEAGKQLSATIPLNAGRLNAGLKADKEAGGAQQALISIAAAQAPAGGGPPPSWLAHSRSTSAILPPGTYKVALTLGQIRQEQTVDLAAGADTAVTFDLASGQLEVQAVAAEGAEPMSDVTFIVTEDDPDSPTGKRDVARSRAPVATFTLPSGTYYVTARSGDAEVRQRIAVGSGDTVRQTLLMPLVPVKVSTVIAGQPATDGQGLL